MTTIIVLAFLHVAGVWPVRSEVAIEAIVKWWNLRSMEILTRVMSAVWAPEAATPKPYTYTYAYLLHLHLHLHLHIPASITITRLARVSTSATYSKTAMIVHQGGRSPPSEACDQFIMLGQPAI